MSFFVIRTQRFGEYIYIYIYITTKDALISKIKNSIKKSSVWIISELFLRSSQPWGFLCGNPGGQNTIFGECNWWIAEWAQISSAMTVIELFWSLGVLRYIKTLLGLFYQGPKCSFHQRGVFKAEVRYKAADWASVKLMRTSATSLATNISDTLLYSPVRQWRATMTMYRHLGEKS